MICDCFPFFKELDILEIRLEELYPVVDRFVIIESDKSFKGNSKEFVFYNNRERFLKYKDKIKYLQFHMPNKNLTLMDEWNQKNSLMTGLEDCQDNDIIMFSDVDEFPRRENLIKAIELFKTGNHSKITFDVRRYNYYLNGLCKEGDENTVCYGTVMFSYKYMKEHPHLVKLRNSRCDDSCYHMKDSGWHLTYIGSLKDIHEKITNWTHWAEFVGKNSEEYIQGRIEQGVHLDDRTKGRIVWTDIDESFPIAVKNNIEKYKHLIKV